MKKSGTAEPLQKRKDTLLHSFTHFYTFLHFFTLFHTLLHIFTHFYTFLHSFTLFSHYFTLFHTLLHIFTHFYTFLHSFTLLTMEQFDGINFIPSESSESNKFCCIYCPKMFKRNDSLKRHQKEACR